jgi:hypothetical protein
LSLHSQFSPQIQGAIFPYFTQFDPELSRESTGRDPLGLLPVWSAIGRELVPNLASPVLQANGIRAVLLIHWLCEQPRLQKLLNTNARRRGFIRLMEGVVEYWFKATDRAICYGSQALVGGGDAFNVTAKSGKTVANGLYQYYRGSCERAGMFGDDWIVEESLGQLFDRAWNDAATAALATALEPYLSKGELVAKHVIDNAQIRTALETVFTDSAIRSHLRGILGEEKYRALAQTAAGLRGRDLPLHERAKLLTSDALADQIEDMHRCEPFLLVLQDTFDILRASPNERLSGVADSIQSSLPQMRTRARAFLGLKDKIRKTGPAQRMRELQRLAGMLVQPQHTDALFALMDFMAALMAYHHSCMEERGRDALVALEGDMVAVHGGEGRNADDALKRLAEEDPEWDNDYYLNAASTIYKQLHGDQP